MRHLTLSAVIILFVMPIMACAAETAADAQAQKAVLVTGASTGIGHKITERLSAAGYFVYAGARKEADLQRLGTLKNVQAIRLDVTRPQDIAAAVDTITKAGRGLYGLVNNAGVGTYGSVLAGPESEFDLAMNVNVYGPWRISRAFGPLIIAQRGRITTIGSISGILAGKNAAPYAMSKHAMEAFTDSLAEDIEPLGVRVSVVEPGNYNSDIFRNTVKRVSSLEASRADRSRYKEPDDVAAAVEHALFDPNPKRRYLVVPVEDEANRTLKKQIAQLVELNEGHAFTYDRDALVKMLDEALAKSQPRTR